MGKKVGGEEREKIRGEKKFLCGEKRGLLEKMVWEKGEMVGKMVWEKRFGKGVCERAFGKLVFRNERFGRGKALAQAFLVSLFLLSFFSAFASADESLNLTFVSPTLANNSVVNQNYTFVNVSSNGTQSNSSVFVDFNKSLVGWWSMDYYNSTVVYDNSTYGNNATFANANISSSNMTTGIRGNALNFSGGITNTYLSVGTPASLNFGNSRSYSVSLWVRPNEVSPNGEELFGHGQCCNQRFHFYVAGGTVYRYSDFSGPTISSSYGWTHIVYTYVANGSNYGNETFYTNGAQTQTRTGTMPGWPDSYNWEIGGSTSGWYFNGSIDEFMLFNRALSATEVQALYNASAYQYSNNFSLSGVGNYSYRAWGIDQNGLVNNTGDYVVSVPLYLAFVSPTPANNSLVNNSWVYLNVSSNATQANTSVFVDWNKSLVGWWSMDYYNSTVVFDNSTYGNNATFTGTNFGSSNITTGIRGKALNFSPNVNYYLNAGSAASLNTPNAVTIEAWVNFISYVGWTGIVARSGGDPFYQFTLDSSARLNWNSLINGTLKTVPANTSLNDGKWHYVAVVATAGGTGTFFVDGNNDGSFPLSTTSNLSTPNKNTYIGVERGAGSNYGFNGSLDEVRIYNRALTAAEINASYNASAYQYYNNFTSLNSGNYSYRAWGIDQNGLVNYTGLYSVTTQCGVLSAGGVYLLSQNVSSQGSCFSITAQNVTLDCNGFYVVGNQSGLGVNASQTNDTVQNCRIMNFSTGVGYYSAQNGTVFNNTIYNNTYDGLLLSGASFANVSNNVVYNNSNIGLNVTGSTAVNNTISTNNFTQNKWGIGVTADNNTIYNNNVTSSTSTPTGCACPTAGCGVGVASVNYANISNNFIGYNAGQSQLATTALSYSTIAYNTLVGAIGLGVCNPVNVSTYGNTINGGSGYAISVYVGSGGGWGNFSVYNNTLSNQLGLGFSLTTGSSSSFTTVRVYNNSITTTSASSAASSIFIHPYSSSSSTNLSDVQIYNNVLTATSSSAQVCGFYNNGNATINSVYNNTIQGAWADVCFNATASAGSVFSNNTLASTGTYSIMSNNTAGNNVFLNNSLDRSKIYLGTGVNNVSIQWYAQANVTDASKNPVAGVSVTVYASNGSNVSNGVTAATGLTPWLVLTEFFANGTFVYNASNQDNVTFYNPQNFTATAASGYAPAFNSSNATANLLGASAPWIQLTANASACGSLVSSGTYNLTQNVSSTATCFNIAASNVVLDCKGYGINYSLSSTGYGVYSNSTGSVVKNCVFTQANSSANYSHAILLNASNNTLIQNNTITTSSAYSMGVQANYSTSSSLLSNLTVYNNTITAQNTSYWASALNLSYVNASNFSLNNLNLGGGGNTYTVYFQSVSNSNLTFNTINGSANYKVYMSGGSLDNVSYNAIGATGGTMGIQSTSTYLTIQGNRLKVNYGMSVSGSNALITNNTISSVGYSDAGISISSSNSNVSYNSITTQAGTGTLTTVSISSISNLAGTSNNIVQAATESGSRGLVFTGSNNNVTLPLQNVTANVSTSALLYDSSTNSNATLADSTVNTTPSGTPDINFSASSSGTLTLINTTFDSTTFDSTSTALLANAWWVDVKIVDSSNNPISGARVLVYDNASNLVVNATTNSTGYLPSDKTNPFNRLNLTEYVLNYTGRYMRGYSNFSAAATGYAWKAVWNNVTTNLVGASEIVIQLATGTGTGGCQTLSSSGTYALTQNLSSTSTCFNITAQNVVLDCDGYGVTYASSSTGYGVVSTANGTTVKNCVFTKTSSTTNSTAVLLRAASNSLVQNNSISTSGDSSPGIQAEIGYAISNLTVYNNNVTTTGASAWGVFLAGSNPATAKNNLTNNRANTTSALGYVFYGSSNDNFNLTFSNNNAEGFAANYSFNYQNLALSNLNWTRTWGQWACGFCSNVTLKNASIQNDGFAFFNSTAINVSYSNATTTNGFGVLLYPNSLNNTVSQNNFSITSPSGRGVVVKDASSASITGNTISAIASSSNGILLDSVNYTNASSNSISIGGAGAYAIYATGSSTTTTAYNNVSYNTVSDAAVGTPSGVLLTANAHNNTLLGNTISISTNNGVGVNGSTSGATQNNVTNNTITILGSATSGLYFTSANSNNASYNTITMQGPIDAKGIYYVSSSNNTGVGNKISHSGGGSMAGLVFNGGWNASTLYNQNVSATGGANALEFSSGSPSALVADSYLTSSANGAGFAAGTGGNLTLINTTVGSASFDATSTSVLYYAWWADVKVVNANGDAVPSARVLVYDNASNLAVNMTTNSTGYIARVNLTEYRQNYSGKTFVGYSNFSASQGSFWNYSFTNVTSNLVGASEVVVQISSATLNPSGLSATPASPQGYSAASYIVFNATWYSNNPSDATDLLDSAWVRWWDKTNSSYSNVLMTKLSGNSTYGVFGVNFTTLSLFTSGAHAYSYYANTTGGSVNTTQNYSYSILPLVFVNTSANESVIAPGRLVGFGLNVSDQQGAVVSYYGVNSTLYYPNGSIAQFWENLTSATGVVNFTFQSSVFQPNGTYNFSAFAFLQDYQFRNGSNSSTFNASDSYNYSNSPQAGSVWVQAGNNVSYIVDLVSKANQDLTVNGTANASWVSVENKSVTSGSTVADNVSVNASGLSEGVYTVVISFNNNNGSVRNTTLAVTVSSSASPNLLFSSPPFYSKTLQRNQTGSKDFTLQNNGNAGGSSVSCSISGGDSAGWLNVTSPANGNVGTLSAGGTSTVTVSWNESNTTALKGSYESFLLCQGSNSNQANATLETVLQVASLASSPVSLSASMSAGSTDHQTIVGSNNGTAIAEGVSCSSASTTAFFVTVTTFPTTIGNVSPSGAYNVFITAVAPSTAAYGTYSIPIYCNATNLYDGGITPYSIVIPTPTPAATAAPATGGTSSAGGGGGATTGGGLVAMPPAPSFQSERSNKLFQTNETIEIVRGSDDRVLLKVENPFDFGALENVTVRMGGFITRYLKVEPSTPQRIPANSSLNYTILLTAPEYLVEKSYDLNLSITGFVNSTIYIGNFTRARITSMKESRVLKLYILEMPRSKAQALLESIRNARWLLDSKNFTTAGILSLEGQAKADYANRDFAGVAKIRGEVLAMKDSALKASGTIEMLEGLMGNASAKGIGTPQTERLVSLAAAALERGDFAVAFSRTEEALLTIALETKGEFNPVVFVRQNWLGLLVSAVALLVVGFGLNLWRTYGSINHRLGVLRYEEGVLLSLMKQVQRECFEENKLSIEEYNIAMGEYEKGLSRVVQELIDLETRRDNLLKLRGGEAEKLSSERKRLVDEVRKTQTLYLEKGGLETRVYRDRMQSLVQRLTEVEEKIATLDAERELKKV